MSVCYRYLVKASDSASLDELLEAESSRSGRICLLDRTSVDTPPKAGVFRRLIGGLGVKLNVSRSITTQDSAFYQRISAEDIKSENPNVRIDIDIPWSWPDSVLEPTNWYLISTIFTSNNDSHIAFAYRLSTVCEKVALQSECDHSPGHNTFWFLEHVEPKKSLGTCAVVAPSDFIGCLAAGYTEDELEKVIAYYERECNVDSLGYQANMDAINRYRASK